MNFKKILFISFIFSVIISKSFSQTTFNVEYVLGRTSPANEFFPELKMNQTLSLFVGKKHFSDEPGYNHFKIQKQEYYFNIVIMEIMNLLDHLTA